ncbi:hypothetical protein TNCV_4312591 [Trichonephila clavipes]|nr:hypothetical protein TNCV_4312591 [Trichonephila clavipes]
MYNLGGEVENIVRSHYYIGKHGRKAIGGAVRELARLKHVVSSFQTWTACDKKGSLHDPELADTPFIYDLTNGNGHVGVRLYGERYPTRWQLNHPTLTRVHQNLAHHECFRAMIDDMPVNSEMDLVA